MRVEVGKAVRVGPGDVVVIRGRLSPECKVGRLFVFAREGDMEFAPYVANVRQKMNVVGGAPMMMSPVSLRLDERRPERDISFVSDIDGWIRVMQEIDRKSDPRAVIQISCTVDPTLSWYQRVRRRLDGILPWRR